MAAKRPRWRSSCCDAQRRASCDAVGGPLIDALWPRPAQAAWFASAVFVLNATPGVDFLLTVSRTLQGGARAGTAAVFGIAAGCAVHALAAAFGLAALLALHPGAFLVIRWAGAAYLAWLGLGLLREAASGRLATPGALPAGVAETLGDEFRRGLWTNLLNPKVALFFLAFLPQFVPPASPNRTASFLLLGGWFVVQGTLFLLALVLLAARARRLRAGARLRRWLAGLGGGLFMALAVRLVGERPAGA